MFDEIVSTLVFVFKLFKVAVEILEEVEIGEKPR